MGGRSRSPIGRGLAAAVVLVGCAGRSVPSGLGVPWGATVRAIHQNPAQAQGKLVTVSGEVNRVFAPRWFSIGGEGFENGEELLVVGSSRLPALLENLADSGQVVNDIVQVTGHVRLFDRDALAAEVGADLGSDWWHPYERQPVLVMTDLDITPRRDVRPATSLTVAIPTPTAPITDLRRLVDVPERRALAGRSVALFGVTVRAVVGRHAFWVGSSADRQLFVALVPAPALPLDLRPGQTVALAGVIHAMPQDPATLRSAWGMSMTDAGGLAHEPIYLSANGMEVVRAEPAAPKHEDSASAPSQARRR